MWRRRLCAMDAIRYILLPLDLFSKAISRRSLVEWRRWQVGGGDTLGNKEAMPFLAKFLSTDGKNREGMFFEEGSSESQKAVDPMYPSSDPKPDSHPSDMSWILKSELDDPGIDPEFKKGEPTISRSLFRIIKGLESTDIPLSNRAKLFLSFEDHARQQEDLEMLSPEDVVSCVFALGRVHKSNPDPTVSIVDAATAILDTLSPQMVSILQCDQFSPYHIQQLIYGLGVLRYRQPEVLQAVVRCIESPSRLTGFTHAEMSCLVYGIAQLGMTDYYSLEPLAHVILYEMKLGTFSDLDIAAMLYGAAMLSWKNDDIDKKLSAEACRWCRLRYYSPKTLSSVCISLGRLQYTHPPDIDRLVDYIKTHERVQKLDTRGLCHVAQGMRLLNIQDSELWKLLSQDAVRKSRCDLFTEQGLAVLTHSFGCHVADEEIWSKLTTQILDVRRLGGLRDKTLMTMLAGLQHRPPDQILTIEIFQELRTRDRLAKLSAQNLAGAIVTLCNIQWKAIKFQRFIGRALLEEMTQPHRFGTFSSQDLAMTVYALGKAKNCDIASNRDLEFLAGAALHADMVSKFTSQGWACLLFGLGELRFDNHILLGRIVIVIFNMGLHRFSAFELVNVFFGLGKCDYRTRLTNFILAEIIKEERRAEMNVNLITSLILALSYHQLEDEELLGWLLENVLHLSKEGAFSMRQLSTMLYALIELKYSKQEHLEQLLQRIFHASIDQPWTEEERKQLPWLVNILGILKVTDVHTWTRVLTELGRDDYRLIPEMQPVALTGMLAALPKVGYFPLLLVERIFNVLVPEDGMIQMTDRSKLKLLEFLVAIPGENLALLDTVLEKLHTKTRLRCLSVDSMLRIAHSLYTSNGFTNSRYAAWYLKEMLEFRDGLIVRRLPNAEFLSLVLSLDQIANNGFLYMEDLIKAIKSEFLTPQRRDSITVQDTIRVIVAIKQAEDRPNDLSLADLEPDPIF